MKRKKRNTNKIRTFLLFLFVASVIWVLTKFSKEYTATISGVLHYANLPENSILADGNQDKISFDVTANGFEFLQYSLRTPEINIDLANYSNKDGESIIINKNELTRIITAQLSGDIEVKNVSLSQLAVNFDVVIVKKLPVRANTNITFREGYKPVNDFTLTPDSVTVSGAQGWLDSITYIVTKPIILENVDDATSITAKLNVPIGSQVLVEPDAVVFNMQVDEYTQKTVTLSIEIINLPPNITIKIIPETLTITFEVSVSAFNTISANDFTVVCDFSEKNNDENFILAKLVKQPEGILNVEFSEKKIDYLIFK